METLKPLEPVKTFFNKSAMPLNLWTVPEYRRFAFSQGLTSWRSGARLWARKKGGALVIRANGDLLTFTKLKNGGLRQKTYPKGKWGWEGDQYE